MKYLLMAMLGITTAFAQSEPVTRIKGDNDASYKIAPNLKVPYKQATKINSTTVRVETGSGNMLPDPSFESGAIPPSTDPSVVGGYRFSCGNYGTLSVGNSSIANDGTKALKMQYGAGTGLFEGICAFSTILPDNLAGTDIEFSFEGSMKYDTKICVESYQITPVSLSQPQKCFEFNETGGVNKRFVLPYKPLYRTLSMTYTRLNMSDTTTIREIEMDTVYLGKPKSDEAIVAKFQIDSRAVPCTFSTLAWQGLGTVTNNLKCERVGSRLLINGSLNTGTVASAIAQMPLPTNFGTITIAPTGVAGHTHIGTFFRGATATNKGGALLIRPDLSNLIEFSSPETFGTLSVSPLAPANGNNVAASSERFSFSASIPIAEWSAQTNAAIVACKEGPLKCTNTFEVTVDGSASTTGLNIPNWITCANTATGVKTCTFNAGMSLANKMNCLAGFGSDGTGESSAGYIQITNQTNTGVTVRTYTTAAVAGNYTVKMTCGKTGEDYNEAYEKFLFPINDVVTTYSAQQVITTQNIATGGVADLDKGNIVNFIAPATTAITLNNAIDGGVYNIFFTDGTARTYTFTINKKEDGTALSVRCSPVIAATTASKHAMFTFTRIGNNAYCSWAGDL